MAPEEVEEPCDDDQKQDIVSEIPMKRSLRARRKSSSSSRKRTTRKRTTRKRTTRKRTTRRRSYRKPVVRRRRVVRSSYYRPPVRRRKIVVRSRRRRTIVVRKRRYIPRRTTIVVRRRYSRSYLTSSAYLLTLRSFNYGRCRNYGYYNYACIAWGKRTGYVYSYSYWDSNMLNLCSITGYINSRCIGRAGYSYRAPIVTRGRTRVIVRTNRSYGTRTTVVVRRSSGGLVGALVGLAIFCCAIGVLIAFCCRTSDSTVVIVEDDHDVIEIHDDDVHSSDYSSDEHVDEVYIMGDTHGHHYDDYGAEVVVEVHHEPDYGHEVVEIHEDY